MSEQVQVEVANDVDQTLGLDLHEDMVPSKGLKPRKTAVYLKDTQFLSTSKGLPKLYKQLVVEKRLDRVLKSKKRTNFNKLESMLVFYQLWAHKLYPKSNFRDFMIMSSSIGQKSKGVRFLREDYINKDMRAKEMQNEGDIWNANDVDLRDNENDNDNDLYTTNGGNGHTEAREREAANTHQGSSVQSRSSLFVQEDADLDDDDDDDDFMRELELQHAQKGIQQPYGKQVSSQEPTSFDDRFDDEHEDELSVLRDLGL